ncbi:MAG: DNA repair protein RecO [Bacteroidia bacterium]
MLRKTRGIVLQVTKFSESSIVTKIYTEEFGLQSYLMNGVRKHKAKFNSNIFRPLSLIDLVAYQKSTNHGLKRIAEISCNHHFISIPYDVAKSSVAIFLNEIIYRSIREEEKNPSLFQFLQNAITILDLKTTDCSWFHLFFMIHFTKYLGYFPNSNYYENNFIFNLQDGIFQKDVPLHSHYLNNSLTKFLYRMMNSTFEDYHLAELNFRQKNELLSALVTYFEFHHTHGGHIKSHRVLHEVMN